MQKKGIEFLRPPSVRTFISSPNEDMMEMRQNYWNLKRNKRLLKKFYNEFRLKFRKRKMNQKQQGKF